MGCSSGVFSLSSSVCETRLVEQDEAGDDVGGWSTFDGERGIASVSTNLNLDILIYARAAHAVRVAPLPRPSL